MNNELRYPERHPYYWDEEFERYRNDLENWRNYQLEDQDYNPYSLQDMEELRKRDYYRGYSEEPYFSSMRKPSAHHDHHSHHERAGSQRHNRFGNPSNLPVIIPQQELKETPKQRPHGFSKEPHYPHRGDTDPFSGQSWVY
jgi:hypothetical protein